MPPSTLAPDEPSRAERARRTHLLYAEVQRTDDPERVAELLDQVVVLNIGVAEAVARRYRGRGIADDDLRQAALEGLVKAVHKFDPSVRPDLLTYAVPTMRGEVQRHFRDLGWMVRPPRRVQELQWRISRSIDELSHTLGRAPGDAEVVEHVDAEEHEVREAIDAFGCFSPPSLDQPVSGGEHLTLGEGLADDDDSEVRAAEARVVLAPVVRDLAERDRRILYLRFFEQRSQADIGEELGVTQMQVSRLLTRILTSLRGELAA